MRDVDKPAAKVSSRDPRVDLLRGLSLLSIFVDHTPGNWLGRITLRNFGLSDAAELFVILAGYSATVAYGRVMDRDGLRVGIHKVLLRCLHIYGFQVALLLVTLVVVAQWEHIYGMQSVIVGPILRDGWHGALRGVTLRALPANLDILPLYLVLLALFPAIRVGLAVAPKTTVALSLLIYAVANLTGWNLPNVVDREQAVHWYFNPLAWQLVFLAGCVFATAVQRRRPIMTAPPRWLRMLCWTFVVTAFLALDAWALWPSPFGTEFSGTSPALSILGNEPKTFVSPWRLTSVLAITYLALTSPMLTTIAKASALRPLVACGRNSLQIFALGCIVALFGRLLFRSYQATALNQVLVNAIGLGSMMLLAMALDWFKAGRTNGRPDRGTQDAARSANDIDYVPPDHEPRPAA